MLTAVAGADQLRGQAPALQNTCVTRAAGAKHALRGASELEDVSGFPYITQELLNRGYSEADIHKIMGGNLLRVMHAVEDVARKGRD